MQDFQIPARPWTEADVALLTRNADNLPEDVRAELGLSVPPADNDFRAEPLAESEVTPEETIVVTQEILDENPVLAEAGVQVGDIGVATDVVPEGAMIEGGLPADAEGAVVDNTATDNA